MLRLIAVFFILATTIQTPAFAYIDPATGGAIASAGIGAFVAMGVWFKTRWYKLKKVFRRRDSSD